MVTHRQLNFLFPTLLSSIFEPKGVIGRGDKFRTCAILLNLKLITFKNQDAPSKAQGEATTGHLSHNMKYRIEQEIFEKR